jgi:alanine-synthesizing transaminase
VLRVEGGWYAVVRVPALYGDEAWALTLLELDGVLTQPGHYYELDRGAHLVLSLIGASDELREGAQRIAARVRVLAG